MNQESPRGDLLEVPVPPQLVNRAVTGEGDGKAVAEAKAYADQSLEKAAKEAEHTRREQFRDHLAFGALIVLWILMASVGLTVLALAWHYITPERWCWLTEGQLAKLQTFIFSGALIGAISGYTRRYL